MYLRSWNDIQEWMLDNGIIRWNVTKTGSTQDNSNVFVYDDDKTFEENKAICERVLNRATGDYLVIMGWRTEKGRTNGFSANVCYGSAPAAPATPAPAVGGFAGVGSSMDVETLKKDIYREIKNEFDGQRLERERKEFEEAKRDFEQKQNGVIGLLVEYLAPVAQQLAGRMRPMPRVAGLDAEEPVTAEPIRARQPEAMPSTKAYQEQEEEEVFTDEESDKLFALMARFKNVEPDYMQLIESVVSMAEAGDSTYTLAKSFLIKK